MPQASPLNPLGRACGPSSIKRGAVFAAEDGCPLVATNRRAIKP